MTTFDKIISHFGGKSALAKKFELTPWAVSKWEKRIPAERCPDIEEMSQGKFRCEDMRPDINWAVLRTSHNNSIDSTLTLREVS